MTWDKGALVLTHTVTNVASVVWGEACFSHFFVAFLNYLFIGVFFFSVKPAPKSSHAEVLSSVQAVRCPMEMLTFGPEL